MKKIVSLLFLTLTFVGGAEASNSPNIPDYQAMKKDFDKRVEDAEKLDSLLKVFYDMQFYRNPDLSLPQPLPFSFSKLKEKVQKKFQKSIALFDEKNLKSSDDALNVHQKNPSATDPTPTQMPSTLF